MRSCIQPEMALNGTQRHSMIPIRDHPVRMPIDTTLLLLNVLDQILNGADLQAPLLAKLQASVPSHHTRLLHDRLARDRFSILNQFADDPDLGLTSETAEFHRRLGMAGPDEDATIASPERDDMSGTTETRNRGLRTGERTARQGTIMGRNARRDTFIIRVDRDRIRRTVRILVVRNHLRQLQLGSALRSDRRTDQAAGMADHERHLLGRDILGGDDEITFILAVLGVENDDELPRAEGLDRGLDRVEALGQGEGAGRLHTGVFGWTAVLG